MTRLKQLSEGHQEIIFQWLQEKPQEEVAALIVRNFDIEPGSPESWPRLLSEWFAWYRRQQDLRQANTISRQIAEIYQSGAKSTDPEQLRRYQLDMVTLWLERCDAAKKDPGLMLDLAKELRAGMEAQTRAEQGDRKIKLAARRVKVAERKLDDLKGILTDGDLSIEEREQRMKEKFGIA